MRTFLEYVTEEIEKIDNLKFIIGNDDDYFFNKKSIVTFNSDDIKNYVKFGKTAGIASHACKHLDIIEPGFMQNIISLIKNDMIEYVKSNNHPLKYDFKFLKNNVLITSGDPKKLINTAPKEAIINFLDMINDKKKLNKDLVPFEVRMLKFLKTIGTEYAKIIKGIIGKTVKISNNANLQTVETIINNNSVFSFIVKSNKQEKLIYLDCDSGIIIFARYSGVESMFKLENYGNTKKDFLEKVKIKYVNRWDFANPNVKTVLNKF